MKKSPPLKIISLTLALSSIVGFTSCLRLDNSQPIQTSESTLRESIDLSSIVENGEGYLIITADDDYYSIGQTTTLSKYMQRIKMDGGMDYTLNDGMITSINGVKNPADWSYCWMLYSNDEDVVNPTYGTYEIDGVTYTSTAVGMEILPIKDGYKYVWVYLKF